jgi:hypothetical protein
MPHLFLVKLILKIFRDFLRILLDKMKSPGLIAKTENPLTDRRQRQTTLNMTVKTRA